MAPPTITGAHEPGTAQAPSFGVPAYSNGRRR